MVLVVGSWLELRYPSWILSPNHKDTFLQMPSLSKIYVMHVKFPLILLSFLSRHRNYKEGLEKQSSPFMIFGQSTMEDAMKDQSIPQFSKSLVRNPHPTFSLQIPTTGICKGSWVRSSATCLSIPRESMTTLLPHAFKFLSWKAKFIYEIRLRYKPNPEKWAEVSRFHSHGLA